MPFHLNDLLIWKSNKQNLWLVLSRVYPAGFRPHTVQRKSWWVKSRLVHPRVAPWTKRHTQSQQLPVREQLSRLQGIVCRRYDMRTAWLGGVEDVKWMRKHVRVSLAGAVPPFSHLPRVKCHNAWKQAYHVNYIFLFISRACGCFSCRNNQT